ncbi:MAG: hypothetical protein AAGC92_03420 [Pseudomonadota bacterium]
MADMVMFLGMCACLLTVMQLPGSPVRTAQGELRTFEHCLAFSAIGMHLGNYLWSGYAKMVLGPYPWTWIVENPTASSIPISIHFGISPIAQWPITQAVYDAFSIGVPLSNFLVTIIQVAAVVVVFRLILLRLATLFYDVLHIGIYVLGGLFFWPWIWNNVSVLYAVRGKKERDISLQARLCCVAVILMGYSGMLGNSAFLGWFDSTKLRSPIIEAHDKTTDSWVEVPNSFFLSHSYAMSHGYFGHAYRDGHFYPGIGGTGQDYAIFRESVHCDPPTQYPQIETAEEFESRVTVLEQFLLAHHAKMVARADRLGHMAFYLRGHHHPSNPLLFEDFSALDLRNVDAYRYLDTSLCLSIENGQLRTQIVKQDEHLMPVPDPSK